MEDVTASTESTKILLSAPRNDPYTINVTSKFNETFWLMATAETITKYRCLLNSQN